MVAITAVAWPVTPGARRQENVRLTRNKGCPRPASVSESTRPGPYSAPNPPKDVPCSWRWEAHGSSPRGSW